MSGFLEKAYQDLKYFYDISNKTYKNIPAHKHVEFNWPKINSSVYNQVITYDALHSSLDKIERALCVTHSLSI